MTNSSIMKLSSFENLPMSSINFSEIRSNKYNAGKTVYVNINKQNMRLQLPKSQLGIFCYEDPNTGIKRHSALISMDTFTENQVKAFYNLEETVQNHVINNSEKFFDKKKSKDVVLDKYCSFFAPRKDKETKQILEDELPSLKSKIMKNQQTNEFSLEIYESQKKNGKYPKISNVDEDNIMDIVPLGSSAEVIIECTGLWVVAGKFGLSWKLIQMKVYPKTPTLTGYAFDDEEEEEHQDLQDHQDHQDHQEDYQDLQEEHQDQEDHQEEDELDNGGNIPEEKPKSSSRRVKKA